MIRRVRARLSYANVAATLALFLALSGSAAWALGRNSVGTRELANDAVKGRHVEEGKLKGKHIQEGTLGGREINEQGLDAAVPQADGSSTFARVRRDATVIDALSRNIASANVTSPDAGIYCFDLPFNPAHVQVMPGADGTSDRIASAEDFDASASLPNCPPGAEVEVNLHSAGAGALENGPFFVEFGR
jgi:hypothetical protein